jgi:hypothetical protein
MSEQLPGSDTSAWGPALDAVVAAPANHKVLFENDRVRVLELLQPFGLGDIHAAVLGL